MNTKKETEVVTPSDFHSWTEHTTSTPPTTQFFTSSPPTLLFLSLNPQWKASTKMLAAWWLSIQRANFSTSMTQTTLTGLQMDIRSLRHSLTQKLTTTRASHFQKTTSRWDNQFSSVLLSLLATGWATISKPSSAPQRSLKTKRLNSLNEWNHFIESIIKLKWDYVITLPNYY